MTPRTLAATKGLILALASTAIAMPVCVFADSVAQDTRLLAGLSDKPGAYRGKLEGDAAMAGHDYAVAASFYAEYRASAARGNDLQALKDAFERQVDALILAKLPDMASKAIAEFESSFPSLDADSLGMWKADALTLSGRYKEAVSKLEPILENLPSRDPRRIRAMSSLAVAMEGSGELARAAEIYSSIQSEAGEASPLRRGAAIREILCLAASGQLQRAKERLKAEPMAKASKAVSDDLRLLGIYIALKESGPASSENSYSQARMELKDGPNLLAYNIATAFGEAWSSERMQRKALDCYRDAFAFAPSRIEACEAARRLMNCLNSLDLKSEAADFAMRHFELFKGSSVQADMKLQAARLLVGAGRLSDAVGIYTQLASESPASSELRRTAAKECARAQIDMKDINGASDTIRKFFDEPPVFAERQYLLAELLARGGRFADAAEAYLAVAAKYPDWRERSLYEAMRALMDSGDAAKALSVADTVLREFESSDTAKDTLYQRARIFEMSGDLDRASEEYLKFATAYPNLSDLAPKALYRAGRIAFLNGRLQVAERRFSELVQRYPANALAPNAAYWRIHTFYGMGDELSAERDTLMLVDRHPESDFAFAALFSLASNYSDLGLPQRAVKVLDSILEMPKASQENKAKAIFEKVVVDFKAGDQATAFRNLEQLYDKYGESSYVSDGLFLHADMLKESGDYSQAKDYYRKAMERRPNSLLELAAMGGQADCLFCLGAPSKDSPQLEQALELYRKLIARRDAPASFRNMSLYKAGRCQELLDDVAGALESYKSLIYRFQVSAKLGEQPDSIWAVKAANSIVALSVRRGSPDDLQGAEDALSWLKRSGLLPESEIKARFSEFEKAKLQVSNRQQQQ